MDVESNLIPHFLRPESMKEIMEAGVKPEHFADEDIGEIFDFCMRYFVRSAFKVCVTVDLLETDFAQYFSRFKWPDEEYVASVLVERLKEKYAKNRTQDVLRDLAAIVVEDPQGAVRTALNEFSAITLMTSTRNRTVNYSEGFERRLKDYVDRALADADASQHQGFPLGWSQITDEYYGLRPSELAVVVAYSGIGKSWCCCQFAIYAALQGIRVYFASLENSLELTQRRIDCLISGVPFAGYERGRLSPAHAQKLRSCADEIKAVSENLIIDHPLYRDERSAAEFYMRAKHQGCEMLIGDQLSWIKPRREYRGEHAPRMRFTEIIEDLAVLSRESELASVWAAQLNREGGRARRGLELWHIAEASTIEQYVDFAFGLEQQSDMAADEALLFRTMKSRRTRKSSWLMDWRLENETRLAVRRRWDDAE